MRGGIPGGMNFDTQSSEMDLSWDDYDYYWPVRVPDPPMLVSEAMYWSDTAELLEPNSCHDLYGVGPFMRYKDSARQGKLFEDKPIATYKLKSMPDDEMLLALDWMRDHETEEPLCD